MISCKGEYTVSLINKDTGEVEEEQVIKNMVTDDFLYQTFIDLSIYNYGSERYAISKAKIVLSEGSTFNWGSFDKRRLHHANNILPYSQESAYINVANQSSLYNLNENSLTIGYNFPPPSAGIVKTWGAISLRLWYGNDNYYSLNEGYRSSFVELTNPITQNDSQYMYITYKIYVTPNINGESSGNSTFLNSNLNYGFIDGGYQSLTPSMYYKDQAFDANSHINSETYLGIAPMVTMWLPATNTSNIGRAMFKYEYDVYRGNIGQNRCYGFVSSSHLKSKIKWGDNASMLGVTYKTRAGLSTFVGPIGTIVYTPWNASSDCNTSLAIDRYRDLCVSQSPITPTPTISRVFSHIASRRGEIYSDSVYPITGRGVVSFTGTPTNKWHHVLRAVISNTGEANDTGINRGGYKLSIQPYGFSRESIPMLFSLYKDKALQQPSSIYYKTMVWSNYTQIMAQWIDSVSGLYYTIQRHDTASKHVICTWNTATVESSIPVAEFGLPNNGTKFSGFVVGKGIYSKYVYISTNEGVYQYDTTLPTVDPILMNLDLHNAECTDIAYDSTLNMLWVGHKTGLTRIDLSGNTTNKVIPNGMTGEYLNIRPGQLTVDGDVVCRGGGTSIINTWNGTTFNVSRVEESGFNVGIASLWVYNHNTTTTYSILSSKDVRGVTIVNSTRLVAYVRGTTSSILGYMKTFDFNGVSWVETQSISDGLTIAYNSATEFMPVSQLVKSGEFLHYMVHVDTTVNGSSSNKGFYAISYCMSSGVVSSNFFSFNTFYSYTGYSNNTSPYVTGSFSGMLASGWGLGQYTQMAEEWEYYSAFNASRQVLMIDGIIPVMQIKNGSVCRLFQYYEFGWNGTSWVLGGSGSRDITTGSHELLFGTSVLFNNSVGYTYDKQFVSGEDHAVVIGQTVVKDNLQKYELSHKFYMCKTAHHKNQQLVLSADKVQGNRITISVPQKSLPNFRDLDADIENKNCNLDVRCLVDGYTMIDYRNDIGQYYKSTVTVGTCITNGYITLSTANYNSLSTGCRVRVFVDSDTTAVNSIADIYQSTDINQYPSPIGIYTDNMQFFYIIKDVTSGRVRLALTYEDAILGIAVSLVNRTDSSYRYLVIRPNAVPLSNEFMVSRDGIIEFNPSEVGKTVNASYLCTYFQ